ncbi:MAG: hypothetical protein QXQ96_08765 [Sulfolobales archaeon]
MNSREESIDKTPGYIKRKDTTEPKAAAEKKINASRNSPEELKKYRGVIEECIETLENYIEMDDYCKTLVEFKISIESSIGRIGKSVGRDLEKVILHLYRDKLVQLGIDPREARRFEHVDLEGKLGVKGTRYEFYVISEDRGATVIDIKSRAEREDIDWLYEKVERTRQLIGNVKRIVIIAVNIDREALERARELGINTIYGSVID